jgi:glycosyltransferase involved in cell wall biosynthesis
MLEQSLDNTDQGATSALSIGYICPGWPAEAFSNGVATAIGTLTPALEAMGHRVTIIAVRVAEGTRDRSVYDLAEFRVQRNAASYGLVHLGYRITGGRAQTYEARHAYRKAVLRAEAERKIQVLEMEDAFGWAEWVCRDTSIPVCVRLHGPWFLNGPALGCRQDRVFRRRVAREGRAIRAAAGITAPSRDVLDRVREFYGLSLSDAQVIPGTTPAVPAQRRWRWDECDPRAVLFVGRFDRHKGADVLIEAFGRVLREIPDAHLWLVGAADGRITDGGRVWTVEEFIRHRLPGALEAGRVLWLGFQSIEELRRLRRKAMITVVCSRYETFSSATLEAMTMGCPTVAARVGGIREILEDQVDGLLHRPEDPDDLAAKIVTLLNEPARAAGLGRHAAETCERRFHPDVIARRFAEYYSQIIGHRGK